MQSLRKDVAIAGSHLQPRLGPKVLRPPAAGVRATPLRGTDAAFCSRHAAPAAAAGCGAERRARCTTRALAGLDAVAASAPGLAALADSPWRDYVCAFAAAGGAYVWVKIFNSLAQAGTLDQKLSRKLVHATSGPLFLLTWPLFSAAPQARFIAAAVPALNLVRLALVGSGVVSDPGLVKSTSRSGDRGELLRGPLIYVVVLVGVTLAFWRDSPAGLISISMMCGGDGLADIVGRRWGANNRLPWNEAKSWAGSAGMLFGGAAMAMGLIYMFCSLGYFECTPPATLVPLVAAVCLVCTVVESLPVNGVLDDNLSVPAAAVGLSMLLLPLAAAAAGM